jgi:transposase
MARFKPYDYSQGLIVPVNLEEQIEPGTFEFALHHLIEARYDDSFLAEEFFNDATGRPAYPPKLMLKAILFAYSQGMLSSRKIERACKHNIRFMALLCGEGPDHSTIAEFIKKLGSHIEQVFVDVLTICHEEGLLEGTHFALDGLKLPTDAAKECSGTFDTLKRKRDKFRGKAAALMKEHQRRDRRLAKGKSEVAGEALTPAQKLLAKADKIDAFLEANEPRLGVSGKEVQSNMTDPESSKMHTSKGTTQGYNCQALADGSHQIITNASVPEGGQDGRVLGELFEQAARQAEAAGLGKDFYQGKELLADANYHSEPNLEVCAEHRLDAVIPDPNHRDRDERYTGRDKHLRKVRPKNTDRFTKADFDYNEDSDTYRCPRGRTLRRKPGTGTSTGGKGKGKFYRYTADSDFCEICEFRKQCLSKNGKRRSLSRCIEPARPNCHAMRAKVDTPEARQRYSYRMGTIEPIFANLRHAKGLNRINYRGREKIAVIWTLWSIMHNIGKIALYRPEYGRRAATAG